MSLLNRRSVAIFVTAVAFLSSNFQYVSAEIEYTITDLGTLPGQPYSEALAVNDSGQVAGVSGGGGNITFLYSGGVMNNLGTLPGMTTSNVTAMNATGQLVGTSSNSLSTHAFLYSGGAMVDLTALLGGQLSGQMVNASGINNSGQIALSAYDPPTSALQPWLYSGGLMTPLPILPGGRQADTVGINNNGQVVGKSQTSIAWYAVLWSGGTVTNLGALTGAVNKGGFFSAGRAINDGAQVVGNSATAAGGSDAVMWSNGTITDLGALPGDPYCVAYDINDLCQVVGISENLNLGTQAFLYEDGAMENLTDLIDPSLDWTLQAATGINDLGQIVGYGVNGAGPNHAFLLTPIPSVPEPASVCFLSLCVLALFASRRG